MILIDRVKIKMGGMTSLIKKYTSNTGLPDSGAPSMQDIARHQSRLQIAESRRQLTLLGLLIDFSNRLSDSGITDGQEVREELRMMAHLFSASRRFDYELYASQRIREIQEGSDESDEESDDEIPENILMFASDPETMGQTLEEPKPLEDYPEDNPLADECAICFEKTKLLITRCRHVVCSECIVKVEKCPVCREPIVKSLIKRR